MSSAVIDGLRCVVQQTQRHGGRQTDIFGSVGFNNNGWGAENGPNPSIAAQGGFAAGITRFFQTFYRTDSALGCQTGLNTSQAIEVLFLP